MSTSLTMASVDYEDAANKALQGAYPDEPSIDAAVRTAEAQVWATLAVMAELRAARAMRNARARYMGSLL